MDYKMELTITEYQHCHLIEVKGRVDSFSAPKIGQTLKTLIEDGHHNFVVDLEQVAFISSSGILVFVNAQKRLKMKTGGEIVFANVPQLIFSAVEIAGFDRIFTFYKDTLSAVESFQQD